MGVHGGKINYQQRPYVLGIFNRPSCCWSMMLAKSTVAGVCVWRGVSFVQGRESVIWCSFFLSQPHVVQTLCTSSACEIRVFFFFALFCEKENPPHDLGVDLLFTSICFVIYLSVCLFTFYLVFENFINIYWRNIPWLLISSLRLLIHITIYFSPFVYLLSPPRLCRHKNKTVPTRQSREAHSIWRSKTRMQQTLAFIFVSLM